MSRAREQVSRAGDLVNQNDTATVNTSGVNKRGQPRRKVALACEPCREKKIRCDGRNPVCGHCRRRGYTIDRCIYRTDNARTAISDEYLKALHNRIRQLEEACSKAGVSVPPVGSRNRIENPVPGVNGDNLVSEDSQTTLRPVDETRLGATPSSASGIVSRQNFNPPHRSIPSPFDPHGNVTAMGAISAAEDGEPSNSPQEEYYGSSSAASLMRLARESMPLHRQAIRRGENCRESGQNQRITLPNASRIMLQEFGKPSTRFQYDDFSLPPRPLADHLLDCFWDRVYCLYPFFHRPSFEKAYENLWCSKQTQTKLTELNIGLGSAFDSGSDSLVFHYALNVIFAVACHFSNDLGAEREELSHTFFLRGKRLVGLDFLDIGTIGVVQSLLISAVYLQCTPYAARTWFSIGIACRIAQGLGLHEATVPDSITPFEAEIRRRTWHGCVMMDLIVSMTFGRPSMTSHLPPVPLPSAISDSELLNPNGHSDGNGHSYMTFYVSTIKLYNILESILSDIYNAWQSRSNKSASELYWDMRQGGLDIIIELDSKLSVFESSLPPILNWSGRHHSNDTDDANMLIFDRQRNVLHARFIHLRLLLYRPIFTQLCSESAGEARSSSHTPTRTTYSIAPINPNRNVVYSSVSTNCAVACVMAAVDLVSLVYDTYQTPATDAWWYNGFYTSTAGIVLIMSYSCRSMLDHIGSEVVDQTWRKCEQILTNMATFSLSARNSLHLLQTTYAQIVQHYSGAHANEDMPVDGSDRTGVAAVQQNARARDQYESGAEIRDGHVPIPAHGVGHPHGTREPDPLNLFNSSFVNWDEMGPGPDEFGFLGRFDLPDLSGWFPDIPG